MFYVCLFAVFTFLFYSRSSIVCRAERKCSLTHCLFLCSYFFAFSFLGFPPTMPTAAHHQQAKIRSCLISSSTTT